MRLVTRLDHGLTLIARFEVGRSISDALRTCDVVRTVEVSVTPTGGSVTETAHTAVAF